VIVIALALALALVGLIAIGALPAVFGLVAITIVAAVVYWTVRDRAQNILLVFVSVFLALIVVNGPTPRLSDPKGLERLQQLWNRGAFDDRLPVVLHLVFDEMMSPGAIAEDLPGAVPARQSLYALGERYGLRTYDSVYSRAYFSGVSIPNLFNAEYRGKMGVSDRFPKLLEQTPQNAYFDDMKARGYRTIVFQTSHLDFCGNPSVDMCETFPSFDPRVIQSNARPDLRARATHVLSVLLRSYEPSYVSLYGRRLMTGSERDENAVRTGTEERFDVQGFPAWFDRFVGFVETVPRGSHVFAHFMVPHAPYFLNAECGSTTDGGAGYYLGDRFPGATERAEARRRSYASYLAQLQCVSSRIGIFLEAVARNPELRDARLIIHGDHGSRISAGQLIGDHGRDDYISNYATYFAVRAPGVAPGLDCRLLSLAEAFRERAAASPSPIDRPTPPVLVQSAAGSDAVVEAPMPTFGCAERGTHHEK
jgi:sulfatase-like protein